MEASPEGHNSGGLRAPELWRQQSFERSARDHYSPAEAEAGEVAGVDELVGGGAADAEELGGLLDGDGQGLDVVSVHA